MQRADQAGIVGMEADRHQVDLEILRLQHDLGTRNRQLPHPALAEAAADHDPLGLRPRLGLEEAPRDIGKLLREFLDRAVHDGGSLDVVADQYIIERLLADLVGGFVPEGILPGLAQRLAPAVENLAEGALARTVADKAVLVLELDVEAVDIDRRQPGRPMAGNSCDGNYVFSHICPGPAGNPRWTTGGEPFGFTPGIAAATRLGAAKSRQIPHNWPFFEPVCLDSRA